VLSHEYNQEKLLPTPTKLMPLLNQMEIGLC